MQSESVADLVLELYDLARKTMIKSEKQKVSHFLHALKEPYNHKVSSKKPKTFFRAVQLALDEEENEIMRKRGNEDRGNPPHKVFYAKPYSQRRVESALETQRITETHGSHMLSTRSKDHMDRIVKKFNEISTGLIDYFHHPPLKPPKVCHKCKRKGHTDLDCIKGGRNGIMAQRAMSVLLPKCSVRVLGTKTLGVLSTGMGNSAISVEFANRLGLVDDEFLAEYKKINTATHLITSLPIEKLGEVTYVDAKLLPYSFDDLVLGTDWLNNNGALVKLSEGKLHLRKRDTEHILPIVWDEYASDADN
ncbi:uncharacterized protein VTP21DRAFT_8896 [Calcarisporiella thermophila]|uniref:uncharacterized protein n=1 Tax=Calcarisporiella thermophila TaxID=911321 RepID=UPI003741FE1B